MCCNSSENVKEDLLGGAFKNSFKKKVTERKIIRGKTAPLMGTIYFFFKKEAHDGKKKNVKRTTSQVLICGSYTKTNTS